jgi:hypothetical protein
MKSIRKSEDEEAYQKLLTEWISIMLGTIQANFVQIEVGKFQTESKIFRVDRKDCLLLSF